MIDFSNMLGKPLAHCFVPADQASITFVFQDGMRRSFGVVNAGGTRLTPVSVASWLPTEGVVFTRVNYPAIVRFALSEPTQLIEGASPTSQLGTDAAEFVTAEGSVAVLFPVGGELTELPE